LAAVNLMIGTLPGDGYDRVTAVSIQTPRARPCAVHLRNKKARIA
jgi:hypothetical protein